MIDIQIRKLESTGRHCAGPHCKKNPKYLFNILGHVYHLRTDQIVAQIVAGGTVEYYCRDCIDDLYAYIKSKLDSKLWIFH